MKMITIPTLIRSEITNKSPQRIPKTIIQTYVNNNIPEPIFNNLQIILKTNPEYDYRLITDQEGIELIKTHFDERTLNAFLKLKIGAAKGDFIRYIALYLFGGVYLDLDASIDMDLNIFINPDDNYIFFMDGDKNLEQFCFMIEPTHHLMKQIIEEMVNRIENKEQNIFKATGPTLFNDIIYNNLTNKNIYDTGTNVPAIIREYTYMNNSTKNNRIINRKGKEIEEIFSFRIKDYDDNMLYNDNNKSYYYLDNNNTNIAYLRNLYL
jgi:mannosyltransferase OCH1-like enzyme